MTQHARSFRYLQAASRKAIGRMLLVVAVGGCAGASANAGARPLDSAECDLLASGRLPDGRTIDQAYDSLFVLARERTELRLDPELFVLSPFTRPPGLAQPDAMARYLDLNYPPDLRGRRVGGRSVVSFIVHPDGSLSRIRLMRTSGYDELDELAYRAIQQAQFSPARNADCTVPAFMRFPIEWRP